MSKYHCCSVIALVVLSLIGCGESSSKSDNSQQTVKAVGPPSTVDHSHDSHSHPSEGPHGGSLIELGNEEYHAELLHDDAESKVTVYLLDASAKEFVPTEAQEIKINLSHEGQVEQFVLTAAAQASDGPGKASCFVSTTPEVCEELCHEHAEGQLVVVINGKQYRGDIHHDHDHEH
jgi:hypothetical protein